MERTNPKLSHISIVIVTLNNQRSLPECLRRINEQDYPKDRIEYLNVDGGSTDKTVGIMKTYGFKTIASPVKKNAEAQRAVGLRRAKHNLIVSLDADNYIPDPEWLRRMVQPFVDDETIVHSGSLHYTYRRQDSAFNRYCALFGVVDPVVFYMGKADRVPQYVHFWKRGRIVNRNSLYDTVAFTEHDLPTVGCNGVVYRKDLLIRHAKSSPSEFIHIDVFVDLIRKGFDKFAVVKTGVMHDTAIDLRYLMKKRMLFLRYYNMNRSVNRRYYVFDPNNPGDRMKLGLYILYTVTLVRPIWDSFRGFLALPDFAWFLHPFMCWVYLVAYGRASIRKKS